MRFAVQLPWWAIVLAIAALSAAAWGAYAGMATRVTPGRRTALTVLRLATLLTLAWCLLRPMLPRTPDPERVVVPVLLDASRSMRVPDTGGPRLDQALRALDAIRASVGGSVAVEPWTFGRGLAPLDVASVSADAPRSELSRALDELRTRYRDRQVAGIVVISDGGETAGADTVALERTTPIPIHTIGVGGDGSAFDLEVRDVAAGEAAVVESLVDITATVVARSAAAPFDVRLLQDGQPLDVQRVIPAPDGAPTRVAFTAAPAASAPTLYTVEIPEMPGELVAENNRRSVVVEPPGRARRILLLEGSPGFEHAFLKRALALDPGLEVDAVVHKGRDEQGRPTFLVQAAAGRASSLATGLPGSRAALYQYDALMLANVDPSMLERAQTDLLGRFVAERGGGLIVAGPRSLSEAAFSGTAVDPALPVDRVDVSRGVVQAALDRTEPYTVTLTPAGVEHPVMRVGVTAEESAARWAAVPGLSAVAALGPLRPGAQTLAVVAAPDGPRPLVVVQQYGRGQTLVFTGAGSWRWRMQLPATDRTHERFWRQAVRWAAAAAPGPVTVRPPVDVTAGDRPDIAIDVLDEQFEPVRDAEVILRVSTDQGQPREVRAAADPATPGRYLAPVPFATDGVHHLTARARRGSAPLGEAARSVLVGGGERELIDPRLNDGVLRRLARAGGGRYVPASEAGSLGPLLMPDGPAAPAPAGVREIWSSPRIYAAVLGLLAAEWILRRRWGLR